MEYNFQKYRSGHASTLGEPYDKGSVMHYGKWVVNWWDQIDERGRWRLLFLVKLLPRFPWFTKHGTNSSSPAGRTRRWLGNTSTCPYYAFRQYTPYYASCSWWWLCYNKHGPIYKGFWKPFNKDTMKTGG